MDLRNILQSENIDLKKYILRVKSGGNFFKDQFMDYQNILKDSGVDFYNIFYGIRKKLIRFLLRVK